MVGRSQRGQRTTAKRNKTSRWLGSGGPSVINRKRSWWLRGKALACRYVDRLCVCLPIPRLASAGRRQLQRRNFGPTTICGLRRRGRWGAPGMSMYVLAHVKQAFALFLPPRTDQFLRRRMPTHLIGVGRPAATFCSPPPGWPRSGRITDDGVNGFDGRSNAISHVGFLGSALNRCASLRVAPGASGVGDTKWFSTLLIGRRSIV